MTGDPLADTPVGTIHVGDVFFFRRSTLFGRDQTGWITARSVVAVPSGLAITGPDKRTRVRTIRVSEITRIKRPRIAR